MWRDNVETGVIWRRLSLTDRCDSTHLAFTFLDEIVDVLFSEG
jgi:hypothetical protein